MLIQRKGKEALQTMLLGGQSVTRIVGDWVKARHHPVVGIAAAAKTFAGMERNRSGVSGPTSWEAHESEEW